VSAEHGARRRGGCLDIDLIAALLSATSDGAWSDAGLGRRLYGMPVRTAGLRRRDRVRVDPPPTHCCRWHTHLEGQQCARLQSSDPRTWATAVRRKEPVASTRFLAVQFHELCGQSAAVRVSGQPTHSSRSRSQCHSAKAALRSNQFARVAFSDSKVPCGLPPNACSVVDSATNSTNARHRAAN
jgi:hypothetical protein